MPRKKGTAMSDVRSRLRRVLCWRILSTALVLAALAFIFSNSLQNANASGGLSAVVTALINSPLAALGLPAFTEHIIRKLAHFSEFALLGFLLNNCVRTYTPHWVRNLPLPLLLGHLAAHLDETLQLLSPGRTSSVVDVWIDFGGVCAGTLASALLLALLAARSRGRHKREQTADL